MESKSLKVQPNLVEGPLMRREKTLPFQTPAWKDRYVMVIGRKLYIAKDEEDCDQKKWMSEIEISKADIHETVLTNSKKKYTFKLAEKNNSGEIQEHHFACESEEELHHWFKDLQIWTEYWKRKDKTTAKIDSGENILDTKTTADLISKEATSSQSGYYTINLIVHNGSPTVICLPNQAKFQDLFTELVKPDPYCPRRSEAAELYAVDSECRVSLIDKDEELYKYYLHKCEFILTEFRKKPLIVFFEDDSSLICVVDKNTTASQLMNLNVIAKKINELEIRFGIFNVGLFYQDYDLNTRAVYETLFNPSDNLTEFFYGCDRNKALYKQLKLSFAIDDNGKPIIRYGKIIVKDKTLRRSTNSSTAAKYENLKQAGIIRAKAKDNEQAKQEISQLLLQKKQNANSSILVHSNPASVKSYTSDSTPQFTLPDTNKIILINEKLDHFSGFQRLISGQIVPINNNSRDKSGATNEIKTGNVNMPRSSSVINIHSKLTPKESINFDLDSIDPFTCMPSVIMENLSSSDSSTGSVLSSHSLDASTNRLKEISGNSENVIRGRELEASVMIKPLKSFDVEKNESSSWALSHSLIDLPKVIYNPQNTLNKKRKHFSKFSSGSPTLDTEKSAGNRSLDVERSDAGRIKDVDGNFTRAQSSHSTAPVSDSGYQKSDGEINDFTTIATGGFSFATKDSAMITENPVVAIEDFRRTVKGTIQPGESCISNDLLTGEENEDCTDSIEDYMVQNKIENQNQSSLSFNEKLSTHADVVVKQDETDYLCMSRLSIDAGHQDNSRLCHEELEGVFLSLNRENEQSITKSLCTDRLCGSTGSPYEGEVINDDFKQIKEFDTKDMMSNDQYLTDGVNCHEVDSGIHSKKEIAVEDDNPQDFITDEDQNNGSNTRQRSMRPNKSKCSKCEIIPRDQRPVFVKTTRLMNMIVESIVDVNYICLGEIHFKYFENKWNFTDHSYVNDFEDSWDKFLKTGQKFGRKYNIGNGIFCSAILQNGSHKGWCVKQKPVNEDRLSVAGKNEDINGHSSYVDGMDLDNNDLPSISSSSAYMYCREIDLSESSCSIYDEENCVLQCPINAMPDDTIIIRNDQPLLDDDLSSNDGSENKDLKNEPTSSFANIKNRFQEITTVFKQTSLANNSSASLYRTQEIFQDDENKEKKFTDTAKEMVTATFKDLTNVMNKMQLFSERQQEDNHETTSPILCVMSEEFIQVRERYIVPLKETVRKISLMLFNNNLNDQYWLANDFQNPQIGWLIRSDLCTIIAQFLTIGLSPNHTVLLSLFAKPRPISHWRLVKEFSYSLPNHHYEFTVVVENIEMIRSLTNDHSKFRQYICELLNRDSEINGSKLIVTFFKLFPSSSIISKFYAENSFWRMNENPSFQVLCDEVVATLKQLDGLPFRLHSEFENQIAILNTESERQLTDLTRHKNKNEVMYMLE